MQVSHSIFTVFGVETEGKDKGVALGSAVAIDKNILATNCHVAFAGNFLIVYINDTPQRGQLYYYDRDNDLCLIKISDTTFTPVKIRSSISVNIGEEVFAIGNPEGYEKTISKGIISNKYTKGKYEILQTDASISHGSSGGGLFDVNGNLIGITTAGDPNGTNIGFAIPTELITVAMQKEHPSSMEQQPSPEPTTINSNQSTTAEGQQTSMQQTESTNAHQDSNKPKNNGLTRIAYYGKSEVGLMKWNGKCFIAIPGRYKPDQPTSLAIWFPDTPNKILIFSKIINADNAIEFMNNISPTDNTKYIESKSFIFFNDKLYGLSLLSINNDHYPVYSFSVKNDLTENLVTSDYFLGQFYDYDHQQDITTIKFGLDGFTEALAEYNKICTKNE
jgi:serine protease Do